MSSFRPDLPDSSLQQERGWLQGAILSGVAYGAVIILFSKCVLFLFSQLRAPTRTRFTIILFTYTCLIFILSTLFMGSLAKFTEMAFIDNRMFPGGPSAYEDAMFSAPQSVLGNASFVIGNWLSDGIVVCLLLLDSKFTYQL